MGAVSSSKFVQRYDYEHVVSELREFVHLFSRKQIWALCNAGSILRNCCFVDLSDNRDGDAPHNTSDLSSLLDEIRTQGWVVENSEHVCKTLKLVLLEWSETESDCKFGFSMLKNPSVQIFGAIGATSGV